MVASLLDKAPNLAGLARTCEVGLLSPLPVLPRPGLPVAWHPPLHHPQCSVLCPALVKQPLTLRIMARPTAVLAVGK